VVVSQKNKRKSRGEQSEKKIEVRRDDIEGVIEREVKECVYGRPKDIKKISIITTCTAQLPHTPAEFEDMRGYGGLEFAFAFFSHSFRFLYSYTLLDT